MVIETAGRTINRNTEGLSEANEEHSFSNKVIRVSEELRVQSYRWHHSIARENIPQLFRPDPRDCSIRPQGLQEKNILPIIVQL